MDDKIAKTAYKATILPVHELQTAVCNQKLRQQRTRSAALYPRLALYEAAERVLNNESKKDNPC